MSETLFTIPEDFYQPKILTDEDIYKLPPIVKFISGDFRQVLNCAKSKLERKYYAASFILGQPFA